MRGKVLQEMSIMKWDGTMVRAIPGVRWTKSGITLGEMFARVPNPTVHCDTAPLYPC